MVVIQEHMCSWQSYRFLCFTTRRHAEIYLRSVKISTLFTFYVRRKRGGVRQIRCARQHPGTGSVTMKVAPRREKQQQQVHGAQRGFKTQNGQPLYR